MSDPLRGPVWVPPRPSTSRDEPPDLEAENAELARRYPNAYRIAPGDTRTVEEADRQLSAKYPSPYRVA